MNGFKKLG